MGRKRGWCGGRRRDWKLRWQERNIGTVENVDSDDGKDQGDNEQVQVHLTFDPDTGLYLRERGEQEGGVGPGSRMGAREQEGEHERGVGAESRRGAGEQVVGIGAGSGRGASGERSRLREQEEGAEARSRVEQQESILWPGCLFDSHCHLNLVLR